MLTLACPVPDGNIPITKRDKRDDLREILVQLGFEFLVEKNLEEIRTELDSEGKGIVHIDKFSEWIVNKLDIYLNKNTKLSKFECRKEIFQNLANFFSNSPYDIIFENVIYPEEGLCSLVLENCLARRIEFGVIINSLLIVN